MTTELLAVVAILYAFVSSVVVVLIAGWSSSYRSAEEPRVVRGETVPAFMAGRQRGFTMTELMVTVGIAAILTAVAAPPLMAMIASQRVKTATFDLYSAMSYARSEAIKRNAVVTITPRNGAFSNGYDLVVAGMTLRSQVGSPGISISSPAGVPLAFDGYGRLTAPTRYQMELTSGSVGATPKRCLVVNASGLPAIRVDNNHDGNCING
jgi:type IV fimbrial biogenesis protein FimT